MAMELVGQLQASKQSKEIAENGLKLEDAQKERIVHLLTLKIAKEFQRDVDEERVVIGLQVGVEVGEVRGAAVEDQAPEKPERRKERIRHEGSHPQVKKTGGPAKST